MSAIMRVLSLLGTLSLLACGGALREDAEQGEAAGSRRLGAIEPTMGGEGGAGEASQERCSDAEEGREAPPCAPTSDTAGRDSEARVWIEGQALASLGGAAESLEVSAEGDERVYRQLRLDDEALDSALDAVDCDLARTLRDRVCDLAERICELSEEDPEEAETRERCLDGRGRCERARRSVRARCGG